MSGLLVTPNEAPAISSRIACQLPAGSLLFEAGREGQAWRIRQGVIRLDAEEPDGEARFASLAVAGDILGCETLLFGVYTFRATALTQCALMPWPEGEGALAGESMLASLAAAQRRAAEIVALRGGQAIERILGLVRLLADPAGNLVLPMRQDIADITDLRFETVSRLIKQLERTLVLKPVRVEGVHATRSFRVDLAAIA